MKMKGIIAAVILCGLTGFYSCEKAHGEVIETNVIDQEKIKSEIISMEQAFAESVNLANVNGVSAYYAEDAKSFVSGMQPEIGKDAILSSYKANQDLLPAGSKISLIADEFLISDDGNQVVELGTYTISDSTNPSMMSGHFISVFEKRDGKYVCVRHMTSDGSSKK